MSNYFNPIKFEEIFKLSKINPLLAKERFEEYLNKYPKDYVTQVFYAGLLTKLRNLSKAEEILNNTELTALNDNNYRNKNEKIKSLMKSLIITKLKLLLYQEKYTDFYKLYNENYPLVCEKINKNGTVITYCKNKLGIFETEEEDNYSYIYKQIISYKEEAFLEHLKKHLADYAINMEDASKSIFVPDFPVDKILKEIKKYIPSNNCLYPGFFENEYIFKYKECGRENYKITDYFKVFTFHNTENIITITPSINSENLPYTDLNYLKKENTSKVKRLSQIEKFNKKYNK